MTFSRPPRGSPGQGLPPLNPDRGNRHIATGKHGPAFSKVRDGGGNNLADQPRVVFIGLGGIALPFIHFPFNHHSEIADGRP